MIGVLGRRFGTAAIIDVDRAALDITADSDAAAVGGDSRFRRFGADDSPDALQEIPTGGKQKMSPPQACSQVRRTEPIAKGHR